MFSPQNFGDALDTRNTQKINGCIIAPDYKRLHGGTAGNISVNLALIGVHARIATAIGEDGKSLTEELNRHGIDTSLIYISEKPTPSAHIATDKDGNQITIFSPGALADADKPEVNNGKPNLIVITANGDNHAMRRQIQKAVTFEIPYFFDPGQMTPTWSKKDLRSDIKNASHLIANEFEYNQILSISDWTHEEILAFNIPVFVTKGEQGSVLYQNGTSIEVKACTANQIVNPTGCGDAFRAGIFYAIEHSHNLIFGMEIGSVIASFIVETPGGRYPGLSQQMIKQRYKENFGKDLIL
jgi:adenosine kinase